MYKSEIVLALYNELNLYFTRNYKKKKDGSPIVSWFLVAVAVVVKTTSGKFFQLNKKIYKLEETDNIVF